MAKPGQFHAKCSSQCNIESDSCSADQSESDDANYCSEEIICEASYQKSTTDSSRDENGPIFPGFNTRLRSGRVVVDYRLRKHTFEACNNSL